MWEAGYFKARKAEIKYTKDHFRKFLGRLRHVSKSVPHTFFLWYCYRFFQLSTRRSSWLALRSHVVQKNTYLLITDLHVTQDLHSKGGMLGARTTEKQLFLASHPIPLLGPHCPM